MPNLEYRKKHNTPANQSGFTTTSSHSCGFTLVELMVAIAIIAILAVVGYAVFSGVTKAARDAKRKSDVLSIANAYETKHSSAGKYLSLGNADFSSGSIPKDADNTTDYFNVVDSVNGSGYKICAALDNNPQRVCNTPASNCYCRMSGQGNLTDGIPLSSLSGTNVSYGLGGSSSQSCDPNGTLSSGLVGRWKMDESSWSNVCSAYNQVIDSSGTGITGRSCPASSGPTGGAVGKSGNAGDFDGINDFVEVPETASLEADNFTVSAWVKFDTLPSNMTNPGPETAMLAVKAHGLPWETAPYYSYQFYVSPTNQICIQWNNTSQTGFAECNIIAGLATDTWYQMVGVKDGTNLSTYLNGALFGTPTTNVTGSTFNSDNTFRMGAYYAVGSRLDGKLDDFRFYNRALSASEISSLYNSGSGCF